MDVSTQQINNWIGLVNSGDAKARDALLGHTRVRLERIAHRMLHGSERVKAFEQTDDFVQELLIKLHKNWDGFFNSYQPPKTEGELDKPPRRSIQSAKEFFIQCSAKMRDILSDLARKHHGRGKHRPGMLPLDVGTGDSADTAARYDPSQDTHDPQRVFAWTRFHEEVARLPTDLREVVELRWYQNLKHGEIAELLGIAEITVRTRWTKARRELMERFPETPFDWTPA